MKGDDLAERLLDFSVRVIKLASSLSKSTIAQHIAGQMTRSATSAGANYEEARGAESNADFVHKLGLALKEARETHYWLKVIQKAELAKENRMVKIVQEADELCRILGKSRLTARRHKAGS